MNEPHASDDVLDASPAAARVVGAKVLSRVFFRPTSKSRPARTQLMVVARHRRAVLSKSR